MFTFALVKQNNGAIAQLVEQGLKILVSPVRFLVAPLFKKAKRCKSLNFKEVRGFSFSKNRQN